MIEPHALSKTLNVLLWLRSQGRKETTIIPIGKRLGYLEKHVDLDNPNKVNEFIAQQSWSNNYKGGMVTAYAHYVKLYRLQWNMPFYQRADKIFKIPTDEDINKIISHSKLKGALFYSIVRDVGMRPIEVSGLRVKYIDLTTGMVYPTTAKGGQGRILKLKESTLATLKRFIALQKMGLNDLIFSSEHNDEPYKIAKLMEDNWVRLSFSVADKLQQPDLKTIRLYDLRHALGSLTYYKTKDLIYTQRQLGHRFVQSTLRYIHLANFEADEWICKVASNIEEAQNLSKQALNM